MVRNHLSFWLVAICALASCSKKPAADRTPPAAPSPSRAECEALARHEVEIYNPSPADRARVKMAIAADPAGVARELGGCLRSSPAYVACVMASQDEEALEACQETHLLEQCLLAFEYSVTLDRPDPDRVRPAGRKWAEEICPGMVTDWRTWDLTICALEATTKAEWLICEQEVKATPAQ